MHAVIPSHLSMEKGSERALMIRAATSLAVTGSSAHQMKWSAPVWFCITLILEST